MSKLKYFHMNFDLKETREEANSWFDKEFAYNSHKFNYPKEELADFINFDKNTDNWKITIIYFDERFIRGEIEIPTFNNELIYPKTISGEKKSGQNYLDLTFSHINQTVIVLDKS